MVECLLFLEKWLDVYREKEMTSSVHIKSTYSISLQFFEIWLHFCISWNYYSTVTSLNFSPDIFLRFCPEMHIVRKNDKSSVFILCIYSKMCASPKRNSFCDTYYILRTIQYPKLFPQLWKVLSPQITCFARWKVCDNCIVVENRYRSISMRS